MFKGIHCSVNKENSKNDSKLISIKPLKAENELYYLVSLHLYKKVEILAYTLMRMYFNQNVCMRLIL